MVYPSSFASLFLPFSFAAAYESQAGKVEQLSMVDRVELVQLGNTIAIRLFVRNIEAFTPLLVGGIGQWFWKTFGIAHIILDSKIGGEVYRWAGYYQWIGVAYGNPLNLQEINTDPY